MDSLFFLYIGSAPISPLPYNSACNTLCVLDSKLTTSQHQLSPSTQRDRSLRMAAQQDAIIITPLWLQGARVIQGLAITVWHYVARITTTKIALSTSTVFSSMTGLAEAVAAEDEAEESPSITLLFSAAVYL